jgi:hypothetical protein
VKTPTLSDDQAKQLILNSLRADIFADIVRERERQEKLVAEGRHPFSCADPSISGAEKARVAGEEYGEVCKASYEMDNSEVLPKIHAHHRDNLREELIQLAAVAVAWLESIE